ncbi:MAG TPA: sigma-54 dependent transcriptional regulator [Myxococcaceae bacterium]|jgi:DNA-binding NtrC family response regulator|nr:sigma-54 dependent transcriptional regulator [Myxococcaceae bacterium]
MGDILVVDDEPKLGKLVAEMLELDGHHVQRVGGGKAALTAMANFAMDVVVTDLRMPDVDGLQVLASAVQQADGPDVIMMTAHGSTENAVEAMKRGAADYLTKPFSMAELRVRVKRLCEQRLLRRRSSALVERLMPHLVAESAAMGATLEAAMRVAPTATTVLLMGESGTGKSQIARRIHYASSVSTGPLIEVHCAALPEALLESELFGHEKGAFTGAQLRRVGHIAAAEGGTLFLDEIGDISPATQVKLLRFLQDRVYVPLGSTTERTASVRVVAATNRDLKAAVAAGKFREDLYYRLNVFSIVVPPLRERAEDVLPLAVRFLASRGVPEERLSTGARARLEQHTWPGNVRELENVLERGLILAGESPIAPEHLTLGVAPRTRNVVAELLVPGFDLDGLERELLQAAMERAGGNKSAAARLLGITRRRLYSRLDSLAAQQEGDSEG